MIYDDKTVQMTDDEINVIAEQTISQTALDGFSEGEFVRKSSNRKNNFPTRLDMSDPDVVSASVETQSYWRKYGRNHRIKTNEELEERLDMYIRYCIERGVRPLVECCALATGYSRITLWNWKNGIGCDEERAEIVRSYFDMLAAFDADMVVNGKMYPVPYIFRAKNYYDMRDQTDVIITPNNPLGEQKSAEAIAEQYSMLPDE